MIDVISVILNYLYGVATMTKKEEIARKLLNLINNSSTSEGEREAAQERLDEILEKYDIDLETIDDSSDSELIMKSYKYRNSWERELFLQLNAKLSDCEYKIYYDYTENYRKSRCMFRLEAPLVYHVEFEAAYEIYKDLYYSDLKLFNYAFLYKHDLFPQTPQKGSTEEADKMTREEALRMYQMSQSMQDCQLHKMLTSGAPMIGGSNV